MRLYTNGVLQLYNTLNISGDLYVSGNIYSNGSTTPASSNMEMITYSLTGNYPQTMETLPLAQNTTGTIDYAVFTSVYYGYSGSGGTYNAIESASISGVVISDRSESGFTFNLNKSTSDNVNLYLVFMVVYNVTGCDYPVSY